MIELLAVAALVFILGLLFVGVALALVVATVFVFFWTVFGLVFSNAIALILALLVTIWLFK